MKPRREDVECDRVKLFCKNASITGFSSRTLRYGDFFSYQAPSGEIKFARCHGRVRPIRTKGKWLILAQVINKTLRYTMERWVETNEVVETIPSRVMEPLAVQLFETYESDHLPGKCLIEDEHRVRRHGSLYTQLGA